MAFTNNDRRRLLIIHQNFPGQFRRVATAWAQRPDIELIGIGRDGAPGMEGVRWLRYRLHRKPAAKQHHYLRQMEAAVLHGQAVARLLLNLKRKGFVPDVVLGHPGWGETLYVKDVFPDTRLVHFCEWYYTPTGADLGFDPEFPVDFDDRARVRTWNALHTLNLENCDAGITPTQWQLSRHPAAYHHKLSVVHEGIDSERLAPPGKNVPSLPRTRESSDFDANPTPTLHLPNLTLKAGDPVITYVARNLEPYRGIHSFLRALQCLQQRHPTCHAVIVGGDGVSYGRAPKDAPNWRSKLLQEVRLDPERTHFLGKVPYDTYCKVLQVSAAHVYLTYPFVLSWSMFEAMASGCLVIGSRTAPVEEVIADGCNGVLVDFFNPSEIAERMQEALEHPERFTKIRNSAHETVANNYSLEAGLAGFERVVCQGTCQ